MSMLVGIGECMVELWSDMPLPEARTFQRSYGGDVLNSLVMAARLGTSTRFITRVGDDPWTPGLIAAWQSERIDVHAQRSDEVNGLYFISVQPDGEREFVYYRRESAASTLDPADLHSAWMNNAGILLVSGITQAISSTARATTYLAAQQASHRQCGVAYDPNYRPRLWSIKAAQEALRSILPFVTILLPSLGDEAQALWNTNDPHALIPLLWEQGIPLVVAKDGMRGVWLGDRAQQTIVNVPAFVGGVAVDSTAAGDAFNGAFLSGILAGMELHAAAQQGVIAAGLTVLQRGAVAALPTAVRVHEALAQHNHRHQRA